MSLSDVSIIIIKMLIMTCHQGTSVGTGVTANITTALEEECLIIYYILGMLDTLTVVVLVDFSHTSNFCCHAAAVQSCHSGHHYAGNYNTEQIRGSKIWTAPTF